MKKILALMLALVTSTTMLASCGDKDDSSKEEKAKKPTITASSKYELGEKQDKDTKYTEEIQKKTNESGKHTVDVTYEMDGMSMSVYSTSDGESTYVEMVMFGVTMANLETKDGTYTIVDDLKKYYKQPETDVETEQESQVDEVLEGIGEYSGTYDFTIDEKKYDAEKFVDEEGTESYLVFFEDGSVIAALTIVDGENVFFPMTVTEDVEESKLKLPSGYTEMTEDEYLEYMFGSFEE
ncbi:MAG: hypothetical protein IJC65_08785 [Oscillospiraceae bacterium]|nr:hypothetical protein [Oscillospiraceae bacterium]